MVEASSSENVERMVPRPKIHLPRQKAILAGLLVALIVLGSVAVYQQEQISSLNHELGTGMVEIGGVRYWDDVVPAFMPNGTSVAFHGVTFTSTTPSSLISYSDPSEYIFSGSVRLSNGTSLNLTGKSVMIEIRDLTIHVLTHNGTVNNGATLDSAVVVSFPSGGREVYNGYTVTAANFPGNFNIPHEFVLLNVTYSPPVVNPWITEHTGPQAGVLWNYTSNELTFYVSVG